MHALQPNTKYKIVTIKLAAPASLSEPEIADGLNEMLRGACSQEFIADWAFTDLEKPPVRKTGRKPEEGELFHDPTKP